MLFGIGIEGIGAVTGRNIAQRFRSIDALIGRDAEQIADTPGIGPIVGQQIHDQLRDESMRALIDDLRALGLRLEEEGPPPGEGPLAGKTLVLTGTLPTLTREQATERILAAGGRVTTSGVEKTDYVVAGEAAGSKLEKAERLRVPVLDEAGLEALLAASAGRAGAGRARDAPAELPTSRLCLNGMAEASPAMRRRHAGARLANAASGRALPAGASRRPRAAVPRHGVSRCGG